MESRALTTPAKAPTAKKPKLATPAPAAAAKPLKAKQAGRTFRERFLAELTRQSGGEAKLVTNAAMREALGWSEATYNRTKINLRDEGIIILGRGAGGKVGFSELPGEKKQKLKVFISYSHSDEKVKDLLIKHLKPLKRLSLIDDWHDRKLMAGDNWGAEIEKNLVSADLFIAIVSADFINSKYCYDIEMEAALERHDQGHARVIPVIASHCLWKYSPLASIHALPTDGKPIETWQYEDEAMVTVVEGIKAIAEQMLGLS
jgi:hypothetical protein